LPQVVRTFMEESCGQYASVGTSVKDIANFNADYSSTGACENQQCGDVHPSSIESGVTVDDRPSDENVYALRITFKGTPDGEDLTGTSRRIEFDRSTCSYAIPGDWPLAGVEC
jgi:hypothetical protein